jgi:hypothetical protein
VARARGAGSLLNSAETREARSAGERASRALLEEIARLRDDVLELRAAAELPRPSAPPDPQAPLSRAADGRAAEADRGGGRSDSSLLQLIVEGDARARAEFEKRFSHSAKTPLHMAAAGGFHKELVALLALSGVDVNAHDSAGHTPLHVAARAFRSARRFLLSSAST